MNHNFTVPKMLAVIKIDGKASVYIEFVNDIWNSQGEDEVRSINNTVTTENTFFQIYGYEKRGKR